MNANLIAFPSPATSGTRELCRRAVAEYDDSRAVAEYDDSRSSVHRKNKRAKQLRALIKSYTLSIVRLIERIQVMQFSRTPSSKWRAAHVALDRLTFKKERAINRLRRLFD